MRWGRPSADAVEYVTGAQHRLLRLAVALAGTQHDGEDLLQETLTTVLTKWSQVDGSAHRDAYVRRIMVNHLMSTKRRRSASELPIGLSPTEIGAPRSSRTEDRAELLQLLAPLPAQQRTILVLRYVEDLPDDAIAEIVGVAPASVRGLASRALTTVRAHAQPEVV